MNKPGPVYLRLVRYVRRYLFPYIALAVVAMLLLSAANGAIPFLARNYINQISSIKSLATMRLLSLEFLCVFMVRAVASFFASYLTAYIGQRAVLDLRSDLNDRLQYLPLSFFNRTPTATLLSRMISDVGIVAAAATNSLFSLVGDSISLVSLIVAACVIDWQLAALAMIAFPMAVLPITKFSRRMRRMARNAQHQLGGLSALLQETIQGNRVVKAFGMEEYERRRFSSELRRLFRISMKVATLKALTTPVIEVLGALGAVAVLWYGTASVLEHKRTPGSFGAFFTAMLLVYRPFKRLSGTNNAIQQALGAADRMFEILDTPTDVPEDPHPLKLPRRLHEVELRNVSFRYDSHWALKGVNLKIGPGEVVGLVGMSGGGKSTTADLILRFYDAEQGAVLIDGVDVRRYSLSSLRSEIGLVTQHTFLFNDTIRNNIAYGSIDKDMSDVIAAAKLANAHDFIMRLPRGYESEVGELGVRLSGGERQRLAIARALLKDAPILILDEPTSNLDYEAERLVQDALETLIRNRTTLLIAHRLSTVRMASRIAVMVDGTIVEEGTHDELLARDGVYCKLYKLQLDASGADELQAAATGGG
jgi:subfamily B ATP-binding cassette protein MsbA